MSPVEPLISGRRAPAELLLRDVHVLDPRAGLDARHDVRVSGGVLAELGAPGALEPRVGSAGESGGKAARS